MGRLKTAGLVVGLFVFFLLVEMLMGSRSAPPSQERDHSSLSTNRWGTQALLEVCQRLGLAVERSGQPFQEGFLRPGEVLLMLGPQLVPQPEEYEALWAAVQGGAVLVLGVSGEETHAPLAMLGAGEAGRWDPRAATALTLAYLGLRLHPSGAPAQVPVTAAQAPSSLSAAAAVQVPSAHRLRRESDPARLRRWLESAIGKERAAGMRPLEVSRLQVLARDEGGIAVAALTVGRGSIYVLSEVEMLSNEWLGKADNAVLGLGLITAGGYPRRVVFDEYHHGRVTSAPPPSDLNYPAFRTAVWLALAALAIYTLGFAWRFGRPKPAGEPPRRSVLEYVEALAGLYREAGAGGLALRTIGGDFRRHLAERLGLPVQIPDDMLIRAAAGRGMEASRLRAVLSRVASLSEDDRLPEAEVLRLTREIADLEEVISQHGHQ